MSFSKTISVVAALGSIFSVGLASWKISDEIKKDQTSPLEQKITELENQLKEKETQPQITQAPLVAPAAAQLPPSQPQTTPPPVTLPSPPIQQQPTAPPPPTHQ